MSRRIRLACLAACLVVGSPALAAPLLVDINDRSGSQPTQADYVGITQNGATGIGTDFGTLDISFDLVAGISLDDRDRGALDGSQELGSLLQDFLYISEDVSGGSGPGTVDMTIEGLDAGNYEFVGYFHDRSVNHIAGDVAISTDGGMNFSSALDEVLFSSGSNPTEFGTGSFAFAANGVDPVVVRISGRDGFIAGGNFTDQDTALISGFEIHQVPEPAAISLLLVSATLATVAARRFKG